MSTHDNTTQDVILIVDDDPVIRLLLAETLQQAGFSVCEAENGEEALHYFHETPPGLILLDVDMPDMDGFEVCRRIRTVSSYIPVIMVTGMEDLASIRQAYESGATDFIHKPIYWPVLPHRIRYALRGAQTMQALAWTEARNSAILEAIPDSIVMLDSQGRLLDYQAGREDGTSSHPILFLGRPFAEVLPAKAADCFMETIKLSLAQQGIHTAHYDLPGTDGVRSYEARIIQSGSNEVLALIRDMTQQRLHEAEIKHLASYDSLTGLPNRQHFLDSLEQKLQRTREAEQKLAVLFLDLDGFKQINDSFGHDAGDSLLRAVALRIGKSLRADDVVFQAAEDRTLSLSRLGGDEFTVVLPMLSDASVADSVAARIQSQMEQPFVISGQDILVTCSIGIAIFPEDGENVISLIKNADTAMYRAKASGKNQWKHYSAELANHNRQFMRVQGLIRQGMEQNSFSLHYQPKVITETGAIMGAEALLRCASAELSTIPIQEIIAAAEESGLIIPLGKWVLEQACRQARAWELAGFKDFQVAVNLSPAQLARDDFAGTVLATIQSTGVDPRHIELELTESIMMDLSPSGTAQIERLHQAGLHFAIDDFGAGHSSLLYIKRLPISTLKIDRSFIKDLPDDAEDSAITLAILSMARSLGLEVVAEGVETQAQVDFLREAGCQKIQGYLYGKPMPAYQLEQLMASQHSSWTHIAAA